MKKEERKKILSFVFCYYKNNKLKINYKFGNFKRIKNLINKKISHFCEISISVGPEGFEPPTLWV